MAVFIKDMKDHVAVFYQLKMLCLLIFMTLLKIRSHFMTNFMQKTSKYTAITLLWLYI